MANMLKLGNDTGDGTASHPITGVGFTPNLVFVQSGSNSTSGMFKTTAHSGAVSSLTGATADNASTGILSLDSNGFTVGSATQVNTNGVVYQYIAIADVNTIFTVGTYTGNGSSQSPSLGWPPTFVMVKGAGATHPVWKTSTQGGTISSQWDSGTSNASTGITTPSMFLLSSISL